jgi:hypothetical protein
MKGGKDGRVQVTVGGVMVERELRAGETAAAVREAVAKAEALLAALPSHERQWLEEYARDRIATHGASLRKLEKRIRQVAIDTVLDERIEAVRELVPDIDIAALLGTVRFSTHETLPVEILDEQRRFVVVATKVGGELEQLLLTAGPDVFARAARRSVSRSMRSLMESNREAVRELQALIDERIGLPLYDVRELRRMVRHELDEYDELGMPGVLQRVRQGLRRLDRQSEERERIRKLVADKGLVAYRDYFPVARERKRELIMYAGPTNSGKTWQALNTLCEAESGAYLAPLRLLALEGQEEIEKRGRTCSFLTGEERDLRPDAKFIASTIEMLDTSNPVDTIVIDEVQLLSDPDRGWAWCQALVGAPARQVIMTGSPDAIPLVEAMAEYLGEPLTIRHLERHTPLESIGRPVRLSEIGAGTALIAFSRRDVLALRTELEGRFRVAVIYGNLTPEVRREEARRFRRGEAQILVATDAIAMGLNLPIERVIFSTLTKWNGRAEVQLAPWEILQIGGRAGRYGHFESGQVGAMSHADAVRIGQILASGYEPPPRAVRTQVRPGSDHVETIAAGLGMHDLARVLVAFQRGMSFDSELLEPGVNDEMIALASIADRHRKLPLSRRLTIAAAPVDLRSESLTYDFSRWVQHLASEEPVHLEALHDAFLKKRAASDNELREAEMEAKRLTVYSWLSFRFPGTFPDLEGCRRQRLQLDGFIERSLAGRIAERKRGEQDGRRGGRGRGGGRGGRAGRGGDRPRGPGGRGGSGPPARGA